MEEDFSHQDNAFDDHTQLDDRPSPQETEPPSTGDQLPPTVPQTLPTSSRRRHSSLTGLFAGLLVLLLLLAGSGVYALERPQIPGGSASVHLTPDNQQLNKTYTVNITMDSTDASLNPIGAHKVSTTSSTQSLTVPATGKKQVPATYASGFLLLGDGDANGPVPVGDYAIRSNSGVAIEFYVNSPFTTSQRPSVLAHAVNAGPGGNIGKYDVYGHYDFPNNASIIIWNPQPFSGGQNGYTTTVVSQSDIDSATGQIKSTLSANQAKLKSQLAASEQLLDPTAIQCQSTVKTNRHANDQASDVTVTGTTTCSAIAYTPGELETYGASLLNKEASAQWGRNYVLAGQIQKKVSGVQVQEKTAFFTLNVQGRYVLQLSSAMLQHLADLIAGQTQANARTRLLQQTGILKVSIQVSGGLGTALPSSPEDIYITIAPEQ